MSETRLWVGAAWLVVLAVLGSVSSYYHSDFGFTRFLAFQENGHEWEIPAVRETAHWHSPGATGYDGQFYAQLAVDPLLRDPAIDSAMDLPPYRARRILFSWTAWAIGLGRPAWILQVYALQNVVVWLVLAWLFTRWIPLTSARQFALWAGLLLSHGVLGSIRLALPDGPVLLFIALAVIAAERGRPLVVSAVVGLSGLVRETGLLAGVLLLRGIGRDRRSWLVAGAGSVGAVLPMLLWLDYLRTIYRTRLFAGTSHITIPLRGVWSKLTDLAGAIGSQGLSFETVASLAALTALAVQAACVLRHLARSDWRAPWPLVGAVFLALALLAHPAVWEGSPGAFTRVLLPLHASAAVLLAARPASSWWAVLGVGLGVIPGIALFALGWL